MKLSIYEFIKKFPWTRSESPSKPEATATPVPTPEFKTEIIYPKPVPVTPPVVEKNIKVEINIRFQDGSVRGFNQIHKPENKMGHIRAFYGFFDWFMRRTTPSYYFPHKGGGMIFVRSDIKMVEFTTEETTLPAN